MTEYKIELAPSGLAQCSGVCKLLIEKDELRFAVSPSTTDGQRKSSLYRHLSCITPQQVTSAVTIYGSLEDIPGVRECDCIGKLTVAVANAEAAEALKVEKRDKAAATKVAAKVDAAMQAKAEKLAAKEHAKAEKLAAKEQAKAEKVAADNIKAADKLAAKEHAKAEKLAAKEQAKAEKVAADNIKAADKEAAAVKAASKAAAVAEAAAECDQYTADDDNIAMKAPAKKPSPAPAAPKKQVPVTKPRTVSSKSTRGAKKTETAVMTEGKAQPAKRKKADTSGESAKKTKQAAPAS